MRLERNTASLNQLDKTPLILNQNDERQSERFSNKNLIELP